jgi:superfamily II DNA helicase RecQ
MPAGSPLKDFQRKILRRSVLNGASVIVDAPTGCGKTLPCMVLPFVMASLKMPTGTLPAAVLKCASDKLCFVIMISPLKGLIANMVEVYRDKYNISVTHLEGKENLPLRIMEEVKRPHSTTRVFLLCPESVSDELLRALYYSSAQETPATFVRTHCWGVIHDEAHDVALLGGDFRTAFNEVIQAEAFSTIRLMLLSGTWTPPVVDHFRALLSHRTNFKFDAATITVEPNRPNLYYALQSTVLIIILFLIVPIYAF